MLGQNSREKLSDLDPTIKYGGGPAIIRTTLDRLSDHITSEEAQEEGLRILREADTDTFLKVCLEENVSLEDEEEKLRVRKLQLRDLCREFYHHTRTS